MFTIEHEFDATIVTLVDDGNAPLKDDVIISAFDDMVTLQQHDTRTDRTHSIQLSFAQLRDLQAALNLPEGTYRFATEDDR